MLTLVACVIVGLIILATVRSRLGAAERRISALEAEVRALSMPHRDVVDMGAEPQQAPEWPPGAEPSSDEAVAAAAAPPPLPAAAFESVPPAVPETTSAPTAPPSRAAGARSIEETLGARWAVWVGGVALAFGALLLVRYTFEHGWFGPGARVLAGLVLAAALIAAGEVLRRREKTRLETPAQAAPIPAVLTAAGTVAAFGSIYSAHAVYGFIGPGFAFVALGICGLACMVAAGLHGPALAGLGLLGALGAPLLVQSSDPNPWSIPFYVGFVVASALGLARLHRWLWLAVSAAVGGAIWSLVLATNGHSPGAALCQAVIQQLLVTLAFTWRGAAEEVSDTPRRDWLATGGSAGVMVVSLIVLASFAFTRFFDLAWILAAAAAIAVPAFVGLIAPATAGLVLAAGAALIVVLGLWPGAPHDVYSFIKPSLWHVGWAPENPIGFTVFAALGAALPATAAGRRVWFARPADPLIAALYAGAMTLTPLATLADFYLRFSDGSANSTLAAVAAAVALCFVIVAHGFRGRLDDAATPTATLGLGSMAAATLAALALGLVFALDHGLLTVALALAALGAAFVDRRLGIAALRWCVAGLALTIAARFAWDPRIVGGELSRTPIFNWLLWGYGVPALAFGLAGRLLQQQADDVPARAAQAAAILFSTLLVFFEIRHALNGGDPYAPRSGLTEQGLFATASLAYAIALTRLDAGRRNLVFRVASFLFSGLSAVIAVIALLLVDNPLFGRQVIAGGPLINTLIIAYALPAILAGILVRVAEPTRPPAYVTTARVFALLIGFVFLNLELRHTFAGDDMRLFSGLFRLRMSDREWYGYSVLWLVSGIALLGAGLWRGSVWLRAASALLLVATVLKVFLLDLAGLEGILRSLSFIGLGAVLIGIGLVYQRLIFAHRPTMPQTTE